MARYKVEKFGKGNYGVVQFIGKRKSGTVIAKYLSKKGAEEVKRYSQKEAKKRWERRMKSFGIKKSQMYKYKGKW